MFAGENKGKWVPRAVPYQRAYDANLGCWSSFDGVFLYPEYLADYTITLCPSDAEYSEWLDPAKIVYPVHPTWIAAPDPNPVKGKTEFPLLSDRSYVYWGYVVNPNDAIDPLDMGEFARTLDNISSNCVGNTTRFGDITVTKPSNGETVTLYCFREGIERFAVTDINNPSASNRAESQIPVMWDTVRTDNGTPLPNEYNHLPGANILFMDGHVEFARYPQPPGSLFWMLTLAAATDGEPSFP